MTTKPAGASPVERHVRPGRSIGDTAALWGSLVCSNLWSANATESTALKFAVAGVWLMLAGMILWMTRDDLA